MALTVVAAFGFVAGFRVVRGMVMPEPPPLDVPALDGRPLSGSLSASKPVPRDLPWPKYPGAKQLHLGEARDYESKSVIQFLEVRAAPDTIIEWYRRRLTHKGWTTEVAGQRPNDGTLSIPTDRLRDHADVFQQEKLLRLIDDFRNKVLIMRRKKQLILVSTEPTQQPRRHQVRLVLFEAEPKPAPRQSRYAEENLVSLLPFRQRFGDDNLESKTIASALSPDAHLRQWRKRLQGEGWTEMLEDHHWDGNSWNPGIRAAVFVRGDEGTIVALQPGPDNGSFGLVTQLQPTSGGKLE